MSDDERSGPLTHLDSEGRAQMVDVGDKPVTRRRAVASARLRMLASTLELVRSGTAPKGDVLAAARLAGIMAAKRTAELIPLCHPIPLTRIELVIEIVDEGLECRAIAETVDRTGVEMEAMTAVSVAALTLYDMLKAVDRGMEITRVALEEKSGGRSGEWKR